MKKLEVRLTKSLIGKPFRQRRTAASLGLKRINQVCLVEDRPSVRGMVKKIEHLVKVQCIESEEDKS